MRWPPIGGFCGSGRIGAGFLGVNPLHALRHMAQEVISPYSPSSRSALNISHIALDQISGLVGVVRNRKGTRRDGFRAGGRSTFLQQTMVSARRCMAPWPIAHRHWCQFGWMTYFSKLRLRTFRALSTSIQIGVEFMQLRPGTCRQMPI